MKCYYTPKVSSLINLSLNSEHVQMSHHLLIILMTHSSV